MRTTMQVASDMIHLTTDGIWHLDLGFLIPFPSGFNPSELRLEGPIGNCFTPLLCGSQGRCGSFLLMGACLRHALVEFLSFVLASYFRPFKAFVKNKSQASSPARGTQ